MSAGTKAGGLNRAEGTYAFLAALFGTVLVLTNIVGVKLFVLFPEGSPAWMPGEGPLTLTTGIITYPLTFLITDLVAEIWGKRRANVMVVMGFAMSAVMLGVVQMARALPPSPFWTNVHMGVDDPERMEFAFDLTFYFPGLLLFASMTAYLVAQLFDVRLYHFWWKVTKGRWMFVRNNGSTMISQLVDTIIVNSIFLHWGLQLDWPTIGSIILAVYFCKVMLAIADTPFVYLGRFLLRRFLGLPADAAPARAPLA